MRTSICYLFVVSLTIVCCAAYAAEVKLEEKTIDGKTVYAIENYRVSLVVDPARGGAVSSYKDKLGGNVEIIPQGKFNGLCLDHFQVQSWPGEMLEVPYEAKVVKNSPQECVVHVSRTATGVWGVTENPEIQGVLLEKTYTLKADSPALECRVKLIAPAKVSKLVSYWQQCVCWVGGSYDSGDDWTFRPSARGVRAKSKDKMGHFGGEDFLADFSAPWIALIDKKSKSGIVVLSNYDDLKYLYVCGGNLTVEPMFNITYLPAGGSVEFWTKIIPVAGLDNVVAATGDFVAGCAMSSDNKGAGKIQFQAVRSVAAAQDVAFDVVVKNAQNPSLAAKAGTALVQGLGDAPKSSAEILYAGAGEDPLVLQATVEAKKVDGSAATSSFEEFFSGAYRWGDNINTDLATPFYRGERPRQNIKIQKPAKLVWNNPWEFNPWFVDGVLDDYYRINDAANLSQQHFKQRKRSFVVNQGSFGNKLTQFPYDYEELLNYSCLIFGGIKADALGQIGIEMVGDYQKAGGGIVMLGSPLSYGKSNLAGTPFEDLLPVKLKDAFDLRDLGDAPIKVERSEAFLEDLDFAAKPSVKFAHDVEVKDWGKVVLTAGGKPFLVIGEVGPQKARVACLLGAPMGTFKDTDTLPFWKWNDWPYLMRQIFWWVSKKDESFRSQSY